MHVLIEPGFFANSDVHHALILGTIVAIVSSVVGVMTVVRSQSFAGHALTDVATTGGAAASYFAFNALAGFIGGAVVGAGAMEAIGVEHARRRDVATGIVLGAATGVSALFLYLSATSSATTGVTQQVLFGSIFTVTNATTLTVAATGVVVLAVLVMIWRPLLLTSISAGMAAAGGTRVRRVGALFIMSMAISVGLSSIAIGSILSTALLIGPAAAALRMTRSIRGAVILSCVLGVGATALGILFAYDSYDWDSSSHGLPVSFFIVSMVFVFYVVSGLPVLKRRARSRRSSTPSRPTQVLPSTRSV